MKKLWRLQSVVRWSNPIVSRGILRTYPFSTANKSGNDDEWNDAWEAAWLPEDLNGKTLAPWEADVGFPSTSSHEDSETRAFVEDMTENWEARKRSKSSTTGNEASSTGLYSLENIKKDYRLVKQRVHAGLWAREIERMQERKDDPNFGESDIDRLLNNCSEIFDTTNDDVVNSESPNVSEFKNKPDGWESTSKVEDGSIWEMSQREEDILHQEFDRRIAYCKFQIASFIKGHIFSRRRPIDGWKHMVEVVGPNSRKGKGSVARVPALSDLATQPLQEARIPIDGRIRKSMR